MGNEIILLEQLNAYTYKVNSDMIMHLEESKTDTERILVLISHTINAHQIWIERILGLRSGVKVFDIRSFEDLKVQNDINYKNTSEILHSKPLSEKVNYINTKRQRFENTITEIYLHIFNHATYHRGQINQLLVQEGKSPMVTDFIAYNRTEIYST